jgi:ribosomal protein S18 acetylase RimI-like enzyme
VRKKEEPVTSDLAPIRVDARADAATVAQIAALLARAFANDPEMVAAFPDAGRRAHQLPILIGLNVRFGCRYGEVYTTPEMEGAAVWLPPGATFTLGRVARSGMLAAPLRLDWGALRRVATVERYAAQLHHRYAPMPHWYLSQIGVEPGRQGRGIGGALLGAMLARIDAERDWCYLETTKRANLPFYEKHGFRVMEEGETYAGGPRLWGLLRTPGDL